MSNTDEEIEKLAHVHVKKDMGKLYNKDGFDTFKNVEFFIDGYKSALQQNKVSDVSDESESEFELLLMIKNELFEADKLPFGKRFEANNDILKFVSIKRKSINASNAKERDNVVNWTSDKGIIKTVSFGDYISVEQNRYGCDNEFYTHKVVGTLKSNTWMDVPAIIHEGAKQHSSMEDIVACICQGVCEEDVIRYRIEDIHSIRKMAKSKNEKDNVVNDACKLIEWIRENWIVGDNDMWRRQQDFRDQRTDGNLYLEYIGSQPK